MTLNDLRRDALIFIDANVFVYHFSGVSAECKALLKRIERKEVQGVTGAHIVLEVLHRLMTIEALSKGLITPGQPAKKLKRHPEVIKELSDYSKCMAEIRALGIRVYPVTMRQIKKSEAIRSAHGMMTNDSVTVAMLSSYGVKKLATLDSDLGRIPGLMLFQPTDIP